MTGFIIGFLLFLVGMWLIRRATRINSPDTSVSELVASLRKKIAEQNLELLKNRCNVATRDELRELVLRDALKREARAKAIVVAVLAREGCEPEQIQEVLDDLDGSGPEGR